MRLDDGKFERRTREEADELAAERKERKETVEGPWELGRDSDFEAWAGDAIITECETLSGHRGRQVWRLTRAALNWRRRMGRKTEDALFGRRWLGFRRGWSKAAYPLFPLDEQPPSWPAARSGRGWRVVEGEGG